MGLPAWLAGVCQSVLCCSTPCQQSCTPCFHAWLSIMQQEAADAAGEGGEARQRWRRRLHHYLDWLFQKDSQLGADFAELQVGCAVAAACCGGGAGRPSAEGAQTGSAGLGALPLTAATPTVCLPDLLCCAG
jgi:hypothetical protein